MTRAANLPCVCGSGKPFKRCCRDRPKNSISLHEKAMAGMLIPMVRIKSTGGESAGVTVSHIAVTRNGETTTHLKEPITLQTNGAAGDKTHVAAAALVFSSGSETPAQIHTLGNATVSNAPRIPVGLALGGNGKKMRCVSESGLFAIVRLAVQRDTQVGYFDVIFGTKGQDERVDESGQKNRPHIALHPDGNGKFLRLSSHRCELEGNMAYLPKRQNIAPVSFRVRLLDCDEALCLLFTSAESSTIMLESVHFEPLRET